MITERHNVACRLIMKAISKGSLAGCLVHLDAGSTNCFAQQNLQIPEYVNSMTLPSWNFDACLSAREGINSSRPDATHIRMPPLGAPPPGLNKLKRLKPDHLLVAERHNHDTSLHPGQTTTTQIQDKSSPHLALKVVEWKKIAYTDGSCIRHDHQQIIGAGVYIPDTNTIHHVNPNGANITNTVAGLSLQALLQPLLMTTF